MKKNFDAFYLFISTSIILAGAIVFLIYIANNFYACKELSKEEIPIILNDDVPYCFVAIDTEKGTQLITAQRFSSHDYFKLAKGE